jgi:tRNA (guanine37-N1)-methyltransferase
MRVTILTLFPDMFAGFLSSSIIGRAQKEGLVEIELVNLRDFAQSKYGAVDDKPYGGGVGMVMRVDVLAPAIKKFRTKDSLVILMTPQGQVFSQSLAHDLSQKSHLIIVAGHYEGFDERIREYADLELSIGDYVLTGGELPAAVVTDAVTRLIPGVLAKEEATANESFSDNLLEYPQYTRPEEFEGKPVPKVLLSGNHASIEAWRKLQAQERTQKRRPDLIR